MTQVDTELKESKDVMKFTARTHYSFPPLRGKARMGVMDRNAPPTLILPHKDNSINPRRKVSLRGAIATKQSTYRDCFAPYQSLAMTDYNGQSPLLKSRSESKL